MEQSMKDLLVGIVGLVITFGLLIPLVSQFDIRGPVIGIALKLQKAAAAAFYDAVAKYGGAALIKGAVPIPMGEEKE